MEKLIRNTPDLYSQILGWHPEIGKYDRIPGIRVNGAELSIETATGSKLEYQARSAGGGRGFTGDLIVLDEAYDLSSDEIAAMMPTMAARSMDGNPQVWYTSSAGMPNSYVLNDIRDRGISGESPRLAYYEWSAPADAPADDVAAWYQANPALGIRIAEEYVRETEFDAMPEEQFKRERLGIWAEINAVESAIDARAWEACADPASEPAAEAPIVFAVDVPPARDLGTIVMCAAREDGRAHLEVVDVQPLSLIPARLAQLQATWNPAAIMLDAGAAAGTMLQDVKDAGVRTRQIAYKDIGRASGQFLDAIRERDLTHVGSAGPVGEVDYLSLAVANAAMKPMGDSLWKWVPAKGATESISALVAATLALWGHRWAQRREERTTVTASGRRVSTGRRRGRGRT